MSLRVFAKRKRFDLFLRKTLTRGCILPYDRCELPPYAFGYTVQGPYVRLHIGGFQ